MSIESFDKAEDLINVEISKKTAGRLKQAVIPGYVQPHWNLFVSTALLFKGVWLNLDTYGEVEYRPFHYSTEGTERASTYVEFVMGLVVATLYQPK